MKPNQGLLQRIRLTALAVGLMVLSLAGTHQAHANSVPFSHLFVYGDSLSDTGRYFYLSGGAPAPPYVDGRYSDGPLWVEYLAASLRMEYQSADNFAVAGATTGDVNYNDRPGKEYPGLLDEIASFEALGALNEPERALYIVWAGANDFFVALNTGMDPAVLIGHGVHNTMTAVSQLAQLGARHILVINVPDLGVTPYARSLGQSGSVTLLSALYNQALAAALDELAEQGIETIRFDAFSVLHDLAQHPADYGFRNVTIPLILAGPVANPDEYLFWDPVHPTTSAHSVLAQAVLQQLISTFSPRNGRGTPDAAANGLHGLVNAGDR